MPRLRDFMKASWSVMEKTYYCRGFLFVQNGMYFDSVDNAFFMALHHHGRADWEPGANARIEPTEANIQAVIREKDEALEGVQKLPEILQLDSLPISAEFKTHLKTMLMLYTEYVKGFRLCAIAFFRTRQAVQSKQAEHAKEALQAADDIRSFRVEITKILGDRFWPHYVYRAFNADRLDLLVGVIRKTCAPLASGSTS